MITLVLFILSIDQRYHTFNEIAYELESVALSYPTIVMLDTIGHSTTDSMPIFAIKISDNVHEDEDEPEILYVACHHAEEILGIEICMYMINDLTIGYGTDSTITYWINNREIWIIPLLNPEGHSIVMQEIDTTWRKNKRDNNNNGVFDLNYDGVDLNRNYDFNWLKGGSTDPSSEYYRGPAPFSENETQAFRDFCMAHNFVFCITYHSARTGLGEVIYYPWRNGNYPPDFDFLRDVADTLSKSIINDQGNGHYFAIVGAGIDGKTRNWLYGVCGVFAYCIEVSTTTIQPGWMVDSICERNLVGAYLLLDRVCGSGITGCIYDAQNGAPLSAEVIVCGTYYDPNLPPRTSDAKHGRFLRILAKDTFDIEIRLDGYESVYIKNVFVEEGRLTEFNHQMNMIEGSINMLDTGHNLIIQPNPVRSILTIHLLNPEEFTSIKIFDIYGRVLQKFDIQSSNSLIWSCNDPLNRKISQGVYYIVGETTENNLVRKVVVLH